ncbi:hypothetical protein GCM10017673_14590 [Streptosporangium violaceochromogenes]|nr:hypothetical protein GCM10017673_14590 [Streptosporangium violaceochromogenes]
MRATVTCVCCRQRGSHWGRGLIATCYRRHHHAGTLHRYPLTTPPDEGRWRPTGRVGKATLRRVAKLHGLGFSAQSIGWEVGISRRQVERYLAELKQTSPTPSPSKTPEERNDST